MKITSAFFGLLFITLTAFRVNAVIVSMTGCADIRVEGKRERECIGIGTQGEQKFESLTVESNEDLVRASLDIRAGAASTAKIYTFKVETKNGSIEIRSDTEYFGSAGAVVPERIAAGLTSLAQRTSFGRGEINRLKRIGREIDAKLANPAGPDFALPDLADFVVDLI